MATTNITISIEERDLAEAKALAEQLGLSVSAYMTRAARHERLRINGRRYRRYMDSLTGADAKFRDEWFSHARHRETIGTAR